MDPESLYGEIIYYTCLTHDPVIEELCREQLLKGGLPIVSVSRGQEIRFGNKNVVVHGERSPETMHKQVLAGLEASTADYVFLCESDVLYHPSHFEFLPTEADAIYYNNNVWKMRWDDKFMFKTDDMKQVSGICAMREVLLDFYRKRNKQIELEGFNRHYEPGLKQNVGSKNVQTWMSPMPNICIRHDNNITKTKYSPEEFRNAEYAKGWQETTLDKVPGWTHLDAIM